MTGLLAGKARMLLLLAALAAVVIPFLTWQGTWFGRSLDTGDLTAYLNDDAQPRHIQHALSQAAERIVAGDPEARQWYPRIEKLANSSISEIRATTAWVMGQDNSAPGFHDALLRLLHDPNLMVRRNAALSLVRFQDASGHGELLQMLRPHTVRAPVAGPVSISLVEGQDVGTGTLIARIGETELRSPYAAEVEQVAVLDGGTVREGDRIALLSPGPDQAWEALRALYLIGEPGDLADVERFERGMEGMPDNLKQQAVLTAAAIRTRSEQTSTR